MGGEPQEVGCGGERGGLLSPRKEVDLGPHGKGVVFIATHPRSPIPAPALKAPEGSAEEVMVARPRVEGMDTDATISTLPLRSSPPLLLLPSPQAEGSP